MTVKTKAATKGSKNPKVVMEACERCGYTPTNKSDRYHHTHYFHLDRLKYKSIAEFEKVVKPEFAQKVRDAVNKHANGDWTALPVYLELGPAAVDILKKKKQEGDRKHNTMRAKKGMTPRLNRLEAMMASIQEQLTAINKKFTTMEQDLGATQNENKWIEQQLHHFGVIGNRIRCRCGTGSKSQAIEGADGKSSGGGCCGGGSQSKPASGGGCCGGGSGGGENPSSQSNGGQSIDSGMGGSSCHGTSHSAPMSAGGSTVAVLSTASSPQYVTGQMLDVKLKQLAGPQPSFDTRANSLAIMPIDKGASDEASKSRLGAYGPFYYTKAPPASKAIDLGLSDLLNQPTSHYNNEKALQISPLQHQPMHTFAQEDMKDRFWKSMEHK
eukprot:Clim_evm25s246 gene=Clim_evmTU25s246